MTVAATAPVPLRWEAPGAAEPAPAARFLPLMRTAAAVAPDRADLKLQLARALFEADQMAEIVDRMRTQAADDAADPELLHVLGRAATATGDDQLALDALRSAAAKGFTRSWGYLAATLLRLGRDQEAIQAALQGLKRAPADLDSLPILARTLLDCGEAAPLWDACVDLRARGLRGGWFLAVMASTAAVLGMDDELGALMGRARWFFSTRLPAPDGFDRGLAAELLANKALSALPSAKATRGAGRRIDQLQRVGGPLAQDMLARIRAAVEIYVAERRIFSDDPMTVHRPAAVALNSWALAVHDDGHEGWHIHPMGWISGVYYVDVPRVGPGADNRAGAIEFGPYPFGRDPECLAPYCWHLTPEPGLLLLFPSYYAHRTWPTGVGDQRICVAFDIRPSDGAREEFPPPRT